ncbi:ABC transporter ATP-binding protein [Marinoscillum sp.]|uniref:ABC transporter ATP-binding protein n=1 Tax=Marinoscillum sp. TaxID=2024838 RepID=UPI003BA94D9E
MIAVKNLTHSFSDGTALTFPDWQVAKGSSALILGASGCGKTTFLHLLSGLLKAQSGEIKIEGQNILELNTSQLDHFRGKHIGFVFQKPHLVQSLSVYENILLAPFLGQKMSQKKRIDHVMAELGIGELRNKPVSQISQGQAQRVAIARAVINEPDVLFGDEPTASLDDESCHSVIQLLKKQAQECNATLIIATHDSRVKSEFENQVQL